MSTTTTTQDAPLVGVRKASDVLATHLRMDAAHMVNVIKANCFAGADPKKISNEQLAAFVNVANNLAERAPGFNPLLPGMLYAYPTKSGGIQPMLGPDAVFALLSQRADYDGITTEVERDAKGAPVSVTARVHVKGREHPAEYTALLREWRVDSNPNWKNRPTHMLTIRAIKQAARQVIHGIPLDADELRIIEAKAGTYSSTVSKADALRAHLTADATNTEPDNGDADGDGDDDSPPWDDLAAEADARLDAMADGDET